MVNRQKLKKRLVGTFTLRRLLGSVLFIYACLMLFAYVAADHFIFPPHPSSYAASDDLIWLHNDNGTAIAARYYETPQAEYTVLFSHGNYGDLGDINYDMERLQSLGVSILAYDYEGYGISEGTPTVAHSCRDAETALNYLVEQMGIPLDRIILHGRSAGGGPTLYLASRYPEAGVILESTFTTAFRVVSRIPVLPFDKFRNIREIKSVRSPVLVIHGKKDRKIPFWHGEALYRSAAEPKMHCWLAHSNHNVMPVEDRRQYENAIDDFISQLPGSVPMQRHANRD